VVRGLALAAPRLRVTVTEARRLGAFREEQLILGTRVDRYDATRAPLRACSSASPSGLAAVRKPSNGAGPPICACRPDAAGPCSTRRVAPGVEPGALLLEQVPGLERLSAPASAGSRRRADPTPRAGRQLYRIGAASAERPSSSRATPRGVVSSGSAAARDSRGEPLAPAPRTQPTCRSRGHRQ
jgi:hypothetical protein